MRAIAAVYLLLPQMPMLFMGEEWAASQPFPFFCDFGGELADAVRKGRREEFASFPEFQDENDPRAHPRPAGRGHLRRRPSSTGTRRPRSPMPAGSNGIAACSATRRAEIVPRLAAIGGNAARFEIIGEEAVLVRWRLGGGEELTLAANLSATPRDGLPRRVRPHPLAGRRRQGGRFGPWAVRWSIDHG